MDLGAVTTEHRNTGIAAAGLAPDTATLDRTDALASIGLTTAFAALYGTTLCRTVYWNDSAELVAAAATLGIPHPPGYPLYTLVGHAFTLLPLEPALAVNSMSAVFGVVAVVSCYFLGRELGASRGAACTGAALLGLGPTFWRQATVTEAYTPGVAFLVAALWLASRAAKSEQRKALFAAGLVAGLGLGMHLSLATAGLCFVGLAWLCGGPGTRLTRRRLQALVSGAAGALLGFCVFVYLPLRARQAPVMNFGNPSSLESSWSLITGGVFKHWFLRAPDASRALEVALDVGRHVTVSGLPLAIAGLWLLGKRRGALWAIAWGAGIAGNLLYFFRYQVHDLEVFFLPAAAMCCAAAALGLDCLLWVLRRARPGLAPRLALTLVGAALLVRAVRLYPAQDLSADSSALEYGERLADVLPKHAIIATYTLPHEWKYYTVFRWYVKQLQGRRPDVSVLPFPPPELIRQFLQAGHPVFAFAEVETLAEFEHRPVAGVSEGLLRLSLD